MSSEKSSIYMFIETLKLNPSWWEEGEDKRRELLWKFKERLQEARSNLLSVKTYISLRWDSDIILWISDFSTSSFHPLRSSLRSSLGRYAEETFSMLSVYESSPYKGPSDVSKYILPEQLRYFVAYPMKKSVDWYTLPFEERREIMKEHIEVAKKHPESNGIRSYTTYSFGLGDQEFVVIYELDSLVSWAHVVERLREVRARKWITKEEPILVGETSDMNVLLR
jgi:chlorite dismutase